MSRGLLKTTIIAAFLSLHVKVHGQDIHFSQYNASPLLLNPALAGMNICDYRVYANFRTQWVTVSAGNTYRTFAGGGDMSVGKVTKYQSFAGLGLSFFADQAGAINFNTSRVDLSFAYHFMLNRKGTHQISAGVQGGFNYASIDPSRATFDSQFNPITGQIDSSLIGETFGRTKVIYGDAGFGLLYSGMVTRETNLYFGFALNHVNQPKVSFLPSNQNSGTVGDERLNMKITIHGGAAIPISKRISILPNFLVLLQGSSFQFNIGTGVKTILGLVSTSRTALYFGVQYRGVLDAVIANARIDYKGFSCGLSYDINVSKLYPASNSIGAPEISLMYQGCYRKKPKPGYCPVMF
jgi:type IX secretion system PorP/SprF family membrane protein